MIIYIIGVLIAFILGLLVYKYESFHSPYIVTIDMLVPLACMSWVSVVLLLLYKNKEIRWSIWYLFGY